MLLVATVVSLENDCAVVAVPVDVDCVAAAPEDDDLGSSTKSRGGHGWRGARGARFPPANEYRHGWVGGLTGS